MTSFQSKLIALIAKPLGKRSGFIDATVTHRLAQRQATHPRKYLPPKSLGRSFDIARDKKLGWPIIELTPKSREPAFHIVYFHGGGYMLEIMAAQYQFAASLARKVTAKLTVPIFTCAPTATVDETVPKAVEIVKDILKHSNVPVVLLGDSAGAGLALVVAQELAGSTKPEDAKVAKLLLVSPWVDLEMQNPKILEIDPWDPLLSKAGLDVAASLYAGDRALNDPWLSPINGKLAELPPTTILIGSHDIFYGDAERLAEDLADAGVKVTLQKASEQLHVYPIFPTPEGRQGIEQLAEAVLS